MRFNVIRDLAKNIVLNRELLLILTLRNLKAKYIGTIGGFLWVFVQPIATVSIFYFVFAIGFRSGSVEGTPFILWFVVGLAAWLYFNDVVNGASNAIISNQHLVKKTIFPTEVLPFTELLVNLFSHCIFLLVIVGMLVFFGVGFGFYNFLVIYYFICMAFLALGFGWLLSSLQVFNKDLGQAIPILLNIWFWITPIVWSKAIIPKEYAWVEEYNPIFYIVEGYRNSLIYGKLILPGLTETLIFWVITLGIFFMGLFVFMRLKEDFADVL